MRLEFFVIICVILSISLASDACLSNDGLPERTSPQVSASPAPRMEVESSPSAHPSIRSIDFANFTYPAKPLFPDGRKSFRLQSGKFRGEGDDPVGLVYLAYGDATGDGDEEAMVVLHMNVRGSAIPYVTYIYTLKDGKPKLLWAFSTGDRADGGLRQVSAENGELVIELYGKGKVIGEDLYAEDGMTGGDCCPTHFTRARYQWQGNRFQQKGQEEILSNPVGGAPVVMPRYGTSS